MILLTGIPKPPNWFRASASVDSAAIVDDAVGAVDISNSLIYDLAGKTDPVAADAVPINDSQASNINKKATLTNLSKVTGEIFAATNATSALSETDGVGRVNIGGTTANTEPAAADKVLIETGGVNKSATITNLAKATGEVFAATNATSSLSEVDGAGKVNIGGTTVTTSPAVADKTLIEVGGVNKSVTLANMAALYRAIAQMPVDIASSLFFFATEFDFSGSANLIATKISNHSDATALAAKGKLIAAIVSVTQIADGTTTDVISIAKDGTPTVKICGDLTITIADVTNKVGCAFMLMPVSGNNAKVDPATEDIYAVAASSAGRSAGKVYIVLVFQKTA